jgi:putative transposase
LARRAGDHAMKEATTDLSGEPPNAKPKTPLLFDNWLDPIKTGVRERVRDFIEAMIEEELTDLLGRSRYARHGEGRAVGHRHGHRRREFIGTFGTVEIAVPRARLKRKDDETKEWCNQSLRAYQHRTKAADALIASTYLAGTNSRRVRRALWPCSTARSARTWSAGFGARSRRTGMCGMHAVSPRKTSSG